MSSDSITSDRRARRRRSSPCCAVAALQQPELVAHHGGALDVQRLEALPEELVEGRQVELDRVAVERAVGARAPTRSRGRAPRVEPEPRPSSAPCGWPSNGGSAVSASRSGFAFARALVVGRAAHPTGRAASRAGLARVASNTASSSSSSADHVDVLGARHHAAGRRHVRGRRPGSTALRGRAPGDGRSSSGGRSSACATRRPPCAGGMPTAGRRERPDAGAGCCSAA